MSTTPFKIKSPLEVRGNVGINVSPSDEYELIVSGTKGIIIPAGPTSAAPAQQNGLLRYNTDLQQLQFSRNGVWRTAGQVTAGEVMPTTGQKHDVYILMDGSLTSVNDVLMHNGTAYVSLMTKINNRVTNVETSITVLTNTLNSLDFGEY